MSGDCPIYDVREVVARKDHRCDACRKTIERGERCHGSEFLHEGQWVSARSCVDCEAAIRLCGDFRERLPTPEFLCETLVAIYEWDDGLRRDEVKSHIDRIEASLRRQRAAEMHDTLNAIRSETREVLKQLAENGETLADAIRREDAEVKTESNEDHAEGG